MLFNLFLRILYRIVIVVVVGWPTVAAASLEDQLQLSETQIRPQFDFSFGEVVSETVWPAWFCLAENDANILWDLRRDEGDLVAEAVFKKFQEYKRCDFGTLTASGTDSENKAKFTTWIKNGPIALPAENINFDGEITQGRPVGDWVYVLYAGPFYR